jgi:hypothetical protein
MVQVVSNVNRLDAVPDRAVWMHDGQIDFAFLTHSTKVLIAGRGWGKSTMLALQVCIYAQEMPQSKGFIVSLSLKQLKNETLGPMMQIWKAMGWVEDIHYVKWKRPPAHWKKPYYEVDDYEDIITFCNGVTLCCFSARNMEGAASGGNYDWAIYDEAGLYGRKSYHDTGGKTVRANPFRYASAFHHQQVVVTSPPRTALGSWVTEFKDSALTSPHLIWYGKRTAKENPYLTQAWHDAQFAASPMKYAMEVECIDGYIQSEQCFYHAFDETKHIYKPEYRWTFGQRIELNYNPFEPLELSWDFGGWFSCSGVFQTRLTTPQQYTHFLLNQAYTERRQKIEHVVEKLCRQYYHHSNRMVYLYGDPTGRNENPKGDDYYTDIAAQLKAESKPFKVEIVVKGEKQASNHTERHARINKQYAEKDPKMPLIRMNGDACPDVIASVQLTNVLPNGKKDKRGEGNKEASQIHECHFGDMKDNFLEQWKPHGTAGRNRQKRWG